MPEVQDFEVGFWVIESEKNLGLDKNVCLNSCIPYIVGRTVILNRQKNSLRTISHLTKICAIFLLFCYDQSVLIY